MDIPKIKPKFALDYYVLSCVLVVVEMTGEPWMFVPGAKPFKIALFMFETEDESAETPPLTSAEPFDTVNINIMFLFVLLTFEQMLMR